MTSSIQEVMTTQPLTITPDHTVADAARAMQRADIGDVLVVDDAGRLTGILTDRDVVVRVIAMGLDPQDTTVGDIASSDLHCLEVTDTVDDAVKLMRERAIRRVPVLADGTPVGIVSLGDLAERKDKASALAEISAAAPNV